MRGKIVFRCDTSPEDVKPVAEFMSKRGYESEGISCSITKNREGEQLISMIMHDEDDVKLYNDLYAIARQFPSLVGHLSITEVVTRAKVDLNTCDLEVFSLCRRT